jgi:signal transduction histidine kinase
VKREPLRYLAQILALAAIYVAVARLGLMLAPVGRFAALVWPPTGIALAALVLVGYRLWPGVALGAFAVNAWIGAPVLVALGMSLGNTLEALMGAYLLRRVGGFRRSLDRLRDVLALIGLGAGISTTVSATIGVSSLLLGGLLSTGEFVETWRAWWLGDAYSVLVLGSSLLARRPLPQVRPRQLVEASALSAVLIGASVLIFAQSPSSPASGFIQACMLIPLLVLAALRFEIKGATGTVFLVSMIAIWATSLGRGPFVQETLSRSLLFLQAFMAIAAVTVLVVGAIVAERTEAMWREKLLAMVSHDLRNPLNVIRLAARSLLEQLPVADRARRQVAIVERSTDRMSSLVRDLMDLSAIEARQLKLQQQEHDAGSLVSEIVEMMRTVAAEKSQELRQVVPLEPLTVICDRDRVLQVLSNLVDNALKFTPAGGSISVGFDRFENEVRFSIADTGPGIPRDQLPHVFERFWKAPQAKQSGIQGVGLGLSIARGIVEAHGGTMWADSQVGVGSVFHFALSSKPREAGWPPLGARLRLVRFIAGVA